MPTHTNALAGETSPYLLQHAHNPVDWMPWGEEALARARRENKLLLVSIGYAACHWCHVMERESFEDEAVAAAMNADYVCVKVDREERPDVDDLYMHACQLSSGGGCGWPLNAVALPDGRPVWAGTYFPRGRWLELLATFVRLRAAEPTRLEAYARQIAEQLEVPAPLIRPDATDDFDPGVPARAAAAIVAIADPRLGGFGGAPKFPLPIGYAFLLDLLATGTGLAADLRASIETTVERGLVGMARGGIYDQLGGGFSRYSVDARWHVPHFEKMLYDNAQLLGVYARALRTASAAGFSSGTTAECEAVVRETITFLERELQLGDGLFASSLDADSEGEEGRFYVWTDEQLTRALEPGPLALAREVFDLRPGGNWEDGKHVLHRPDAAALARLTPDDEAVLGEVRETLFSLRERRTRPALDDKVLVSWNGLLVSGLVEAYLALGDPRVLGLARDCCAALERTFLQPDGRLLRTHAKGRTHVNAFLDDYANLAQGSLDLYAASFDEQWLHLATRLVEYALAHFGSSTRALLYYTSELDTGLVARRLEDHDNVIPASNSVFAGCLLSLGHSLARPEWIARAEAMVREVEPHFLPRGQSLYHARWLQVYYRLCRPQYEVAIVGPAAVSLRAAFAKTPLPHVTFVGATGPSALELLRGKARPGETWIYVCQHGVCQSPTQDLARAIEQSSATSATAD